ncbi:hypothetical protein FRC11_012145 [Ceratobasidium sp. 423]|nr:hypothetical protein FRC11_012145 [Ceratobasidium sp. 423]
MDDEDAFLYGDTSEPVAIAPPQPRSTTIGGGADEVLDFELDEPAYETPPRTDEKLPEPTEPIAPLAGLGLPQEQLQPLQPQTEEENEERNDDEVAEGEERGGGRGRGRLRRSPTRSIDFRATRNVNGPVGPAPRAPPAPIRPVHLTTEYTPKARPTDPIPGNVGPPTSELAQTSQSTPQPQHSPQPLNQTPLPPLNLAELLPDPVRAPPSHPSIDPSAPGVLVVPGTLQSRPVWEVDLESLSAKVRLGILVLF